MTFRWKYYHLLHHFTHNERCLAVELEFSIDKLAKVKGNEDTNDKGVTDTELSELLDDVPLFCCFNSALTKDRNTEVQSMKFKIKINFKINYSLKKRNTD